VHLKGGDAFVGNAKYFKEIHPEGLGLAVFVAGVVPSLAKKQCSRFNFVPVKTHLALIKRAWIVLESMFISIGDIVI
jgi:hypothetical protein